MSRAELARKADISPLTILKIENGQPCRPETARKIFIGLGYRPEDRDRLLNELGAFESLEETNVEEDVAPKAKKKA
jgi:transcriptional regulator with XRE-family HTH domain